MQESKGMTRRIWMALILVGSACRREAASPNVLTETFPGGWRRTGLRVAGAFEAPDPVPRVSIRRLEIASYEGPGKLETRVYVVSSAAIGLDMVQRWHPSADTVYFYRDRFFVVIKWEQADRQALHEFVRELQRRLGQA